MPEVAVTTILKVLTDEAEDVAGAVELAWLVTAPVPHPLCEAMTIAMMTMTIAILK